MIGYLSIRCRAAIAIDNCVKVNLDLIDTDRDGRISFQELPSLRLFTKSTNHDG